MAVRRLARQGLLWTEAPPIASTSGGRQSCPACRHSSSSALPLQSARTHHSEDSHSHRTTSKQPSSSWAVLSRASQALFSPTVQSTNNSSPPASTQLTGVAAELVQELKLSHPDPHRVWNLFSQVDLQGLTHTLPLISLHALLPAIHLKPAHSPRSNSRKPLSIQSSTTLARAYAVKVDLIRLRLRQAGAKPGPGDWNALLWQYHALRYAPGATKVWDEMIESGHVPAAAVCTRMFETMAGWIEMHGRASGKAVERTAAQPLLRKAVTMLEDIAGDPKRLDAVLEPFFAIVTKAKDRRVLTTVFKDLYGFDIAYPGAVVDLSDAQKAKTRPMGEREVCWALEGLDYLDDLSTMIAVFEIFDNPSKRSSNPDFFTQSFSTPTSPSTATEKPHPIGTRAFTILIQAAIRLNTGPVARHYFDTLFTRWATDANFRISELEQAVGSAIETSSLEESTSSESLDSTSSESPSPETISSDPQPTLPFGSLALSTTPPARPWAVPSALIGNISHYSLHHYDLATARWLRIRTRRLLQLMETQAQRINAVLEVLEPSKVDNHEGPSTTTPSPPPKSLTLLDREHALLSYHRQQTRLMLSSVKASANIVRSVIDHHRLQAEYSQRNKKLADPRLTKRDIVRVRPGVRRKEQQVLLSRIVVLKHRLTKLYEVEGLRPGHWEFDRWANEIKELRRRADGQGIGTEADAESGRFVEQMPAQV